MAPQNSLALPEVIAAAGVVGRQRAGAGL